MNISARLKIGNRSKTNIKSLTHHKYILSIRFQIAHAMTNMTTRFDILLFLYSAIRYPSINTVINIVSKYGTGSDREIPVLKAGWIISKLFRKALL